jgi:hypothetical protein
MQKVNVFIISLLILILPASSIAAQKAQKTISAYTYNKNFGVTKTAGITPTNPDGSPALEIVSNDPSSISTDPTSGTITLIHNNDETSGSVWYSGTGPSGLCNACTNGVCQFGLGLRAYFEFQTNPDNSTRSDGGADGFTFAVLNASNNTTSDRGGIPSNSSISMGSLLGYAGPGDTANKLGLRPPKLAVEFDLFPNNTDEGSCNSGRNDTPKISYGENTSNHIAVMYWGTNPESSDRCSGYSTMRSIYPEAPMDDNYHGAGDGTTSNPYNSSLSGNGANLGGYYERSRNANGGWNWMEDGLWHRVRIEIIRSASDRTYQVKAWVDCESSVSSACSPAENVYFQNIYAPYTNAAYPPKVDRTVTLFSTYNTMLNTILFGFTEGSGAVTQNIKIANFAVYFPTLAISPSSASFSYSPASGSIAVTSATPSCAWKAHSNAAWIKVTDDNVQKTGNGTVTYNILENTSDASQTGTILIGSEVFTVTQAAGPPVCTLTAGQNVVPYNGTNTLTWTVDGVATSAFWNPSPGGNCGNPSVTGGACTTSAQTNDGARTYTLTVSNAVGSNSCAVTFKVLRNRYDVRNSRNSSFYVRGGSYSSCTRIRNNNEFYLYYNTSAVNIYTDNDCDTSAPLSSVSYMEAGNTDVDDDGNVQINNSWSLVER